MLIGTTRGCLPEYGTMQESWMADRSIGISSDRMTSQVGVPTYCRWRNTRFAMPVAMFIGFIALAAYGEAPIDTKYPFGDKYGKAVVITSSISIKIPKEGGGDPRPGEIGTKLTITIKERDGYTKVAMSWDFFTVLEGSTNRRPNDGYRDTDSAQVTVRWSRPGKTDIWHDTNAKAGGVRDKGADWTKENTQIKKREASWDTDIPTEATHVEVTLVFTDMLNDTNAHRKDNDKPQNQGDAPGVIGSWTGERQPDGSWKFTANNADIFQRMDNSPTNKEITEATQKTKDVVKEKTGYTLVERPATLSGIAITDTGAISKAIDNAVTDKLINPSGIPNDRSHDTGFDIQRR